jgi:hypothetical protein
MTTRVIFTANKRNCFADKEIPFGFASRGSLLEMASVSAFAFLDLRLL